jgi:3',5'-cyclic AMP phosphodiesterase CpdA
MIIAQISDLHVRPPGQTAYGFVETNAMLRAAIDTLLRLATPPDVVLATGDLTDCGLAAEYGELKRLVDPLPMPLYLVPGNHDRREELALAFGDALYLPRDGRFLHYAVDRHAVRLIGLDTVVPGQPHGLMCPERLGWLAARLEEAPDRPTVIFMHHPPFATGIAAMDEIGCRNGAELMALIRRFPNVERVLCGHHHRPIQVRWAGTIASICPSTAHQVVLDLAGRDKAAFTMEPPAIQLHVWSPASGLVSHTMPIGEYAGPFEFVLDPDYPAFAAEADRETSLLRA